MSKFNYPVDAGRIEAAAREKWAQDPKLRAEFLDDIDCFLAFEKAAASGLSRIFGHTNRKEPGA